MESATRTPIDNRENDRLDLRMSEDKCRILGEAAGASGMSVSAFVLSHATDEARKMLVDHSNFAPSAERWATFVSLLEGDSRPVPRPVVDRDCTLVR